MSIQIPSSPQHRSPPTPGASTPGAVTVAAILPPAASGTAALRSPLGGVLDHFEAKLAALKQTVSRHDDDPFDGQFVSADGRTFPVGTPLSELPAATPASGAKRDTTILYVNGMGIDRSRQASELQGVADQTGARVVGLHNATGGWVGDFKQAAGDKFDRGHNPAVESIRQTVLSELDGGREVHLMAHSHGALITSRALTDVREALEGRGWDASRIDAALDRVSVETFGGAAASYPDGPGYVHYLNTWDVQSAIYGVSSAGWDPRRQGAGRGAVFSHFEDAHWNPVVTHDFPGTYLPHRRPFDEVRAEG